MRPNIEKKACSCGGALFAMTSGWCCDGCDRKLIPFSETEKVAIRFRDTGHCSECDDKGTWPCDECDGCGDVDCSHCGSEVDCVECDGTGDIVCWLCHGESNWEKAKDQRAVT